MPLRLALILILPFLAHAARVTKTINRDWTFQYSPAPEPDPRFATPAFDDSHWPAVALPHTWSTYETTRDVHPFIRSAAEKDDTYWWYGWGWYRKHFTIGPEYSGRLVSLEFDGVQKYSKIYLNGTLIGEHKGGYTSFALDLTPHLRFGQDNVLAVQVSNRRNDDYGAIPPMTAGNFDVYGGIYRDVRLVIQDRLHVPFQGAADHEGGTFVTTPEVSETRAAVTVRTWVRNSFPNARALRLITTITDATGKTVLQAASRETLAPDSVHEFNQTLGPLEHPNLWSPDTPYLYSVLTEVRDGDRLADTYTSPLGIRWYKWNYEEKRMYLNGKKILLRGINRHQEFPWLGDAMPKWMHKKDLEDIRWNMGLNFQRTVHYPNDPYVYDLCDRLGFLLIEEAPNIKDIAFGRDVQQQNMKEMIRRDRNHPSIVIWSMGNETNQPADSAWGAAEDPTRIIYLRRGENGGDHVQLTDKDLAIENLLRCTVRGWQNKDDHDFGEQTDHPKSGQVTGTEAWQYQQCVDSGRLLDDNVVVWLYADHGADREYLNSPLLHINPKGWTDAYRFPKYVYYLWQANYTTKPMAFIHPEYWRPRYIGQKHDIIVDSNYPEIELKLNGRTLGKTTQHPAIFKDVEVQPGTLTAAKASLTMAGKPARLVISASQNEIPADRSGVSVVSADIVDAAGVHVFGANPPLTWTLDGPATLLTPPVYTTDTKKNGAMEGTMYIDAPVSTVLRSKATPGQIHIKVSAPGLQSAALTITAIAPANDTVAGITEPPLPDDARFPVARDAKFKPAVLTTKTKRLNTIPDDVSFKPPYRANVEAFIKSANPNIDPFMAAYRAFVERITAIVTERNGSLIADDYNFNVTKFNDATRKKP